jgi:hypothetical protein
MPCGSGHCARWDNGQAKRRWVTQDHVDARSAGLLKIG